MTGHPPEEIHGVRAGAELSAAGILLVAGWFALATGLGEVALHAFRKLVLHRYLLDVSLHAGWMAPLANMLVFAIPALVLIVVRRVWPARVTVSFAVVAYAFLAVLPPFIIFDKLHWLAVTVLAAGLALQAGRIVRDHSHAFLAFARRSIYWMSAAVVLLAAAGTLYPIIAERRAIAALPGAPVNAPNVLLIVLDTVRALSLSLYGYDRPTSPNLARLAARGVRFDRAFVTAPWTLPSHASLLTGHHPHETNVSFTVGLDSTLPTLATVLSSRGYQTAGFVANGHYTGWESGFTRGFSRYEDRQVSMGQMLSQSSVILALSRSRLASAIGYHQQLGRKHAAEVSAAMLRWQRRTEGRPFFAFLNYLDAHAPYLPPVQFRRLFGQDAASRTPLLIRNLDLPAVWPTPQLRLERDAYEQAIAALDHSVGQLLDSLERRGVLENTIVIITADHGEEFGEHGKLGHGRTLHTQALWVPLVITGGSLVPVGVTVTDPVSLRDVPATVTAILSPGNRSPFPGVSLTRFWTSSGANQSAEPIPVFSTSLGKKSVVSGRYHYIRDASGGELLYDIMSDPEELTDLGPTQEGNRVIQRLRPVLASHGRE